MQRISDLCSQIRNAALEVHAKGMNPTYRAIGALTRSPGCFREQPAHAALKEEW